MHIMKANIHALLVLASSLPLQFEDGEIHQCVSGINCRDMDVHVRHWHLSIPIIIFVISMVVLGLPTLFCNSVTKDVGMIELCRCCTTMVAILIIGNWFENLLFLYSIILHSVTRLLCGLNYKYLQGGLMWINMKYVFVFCLIVWVKYYGPKITSLIAWNEATPMICAYQSHLVSILVVGQVEEFFCFVFNMFVLV